MAKLRDYNPATDGPLVVHPGTGHHPDFTPAVRAKFLAAIAGPRLRDAERPAVEIDWAKAIHEMHERDMAEHARIRAAALATAAALAAAETEADETWFPLLAPRRLKGSPGFKAS